MAKKGIVVVTVNYRVNLFGFLALTALSAETECKGSGNYGFMDQNAALRRVQKNIGVFGGDPNKVTIAGESAGSISVSAQMASPLSKGLSTARLAKVVPPFFQHYHRCHWKMQKNRVPTF